jgi:hypothetical protein
MVVRPELREDKQMRMRRFGLLVLAIALTIGVLGLSAGCGSGDSGGVKTYTDSTYGFSFDYPGDWQVSTSEDAAITSGADPTKVVTVGDPDGKTVGSTGVDIVMLRVYELGQVIDEASLPAILPDLESLVADFQSQDPTFAIDSPLAETTVGAVPGYQVSGTFAWDADTPVKTTLYFLFAGDIEYQLSVQASTETWGAHQAEFGALIASFKPGDSAN